MWRRVASLSPLLCSSKARHLDQVAYGFGGWQVYTAGVLNAAEDGVLDRRKKPFVTFVLGGPGSGKGTQCTRIVDTFGFTHLSVGDLLRNEITSSSENGSMILNIIKEGKIVPSEVTVKLIKKAIEVSENDKFLIDGFPRSEENRIAYERLIGAEPDIVLFFDCPEEEMVKRVLNRNQGRIDDNLDTVKERLKIFAELNLPVIKYYSEKGTLYKCEVSVLQCIPYATKLHKLPENLQCRTAAGTVDSTASAQRNSEKHLSVCRSIHIYESSKL